MDFRELLGKVAEILERLRIPYAVTGGYAVSVWGKPRSTLDIDVIIELFEPQIGKLTAALRGISEMSYVDERMVIRAFERKGEFNFIHVESGIKVDFWVSKKDEFSREELQRRVSRIIAGRKIYFISPEDLILNKLRWHKESGSELQLRDVEVVIKFQKRLNWKYLRKWAKIHSTLNILNALRKK
ncbi:MAG: hypothetical protein HYW89_00380 [Candidatus Sungiibacteriota bacterium]|uniref:DUF6036 domain-containing protein n=1 Tax=Candidatus Sungiibacteriota bacterium TaxID=2750080 RepID=A0A7T5RJN1_9BACT|nr:MAG: hypothetical protein HYW89_00380 [Candidatus Sungbacteria bacterium]